MIKGDFKASLKKTQQILKISPHLADQALFQIGLIYAHPKNPDKDYKKSLTYFQRLINNFPHSSLKEEAKVWILFLQEDINKDKKLKRLKKQLDFLKKEIKLKDKKINNLQRQIEKIKEIDLGVEEKRRKPLP